MLQCLIALPLIHTNFGIWGCYFRAKLVVQSWRVSHSTPWTLSTVPENIMDDFLYEIISLNMGWNLLLSFDRERSFRIFFIFLFFYFRARRGNNQECRHRHPSCRTHLGHHPQQIQIITFVLLLRETWPPSLVQLGCILKGKTYNLRVYTRWIWKPKG